jgi:hypothetical protein
MKPSQNSLFKADTSVRSVAESGILGLVHLFWSQEYFAEGLFTEEEWEAWEAWMTRSFAKSPIMCKRLNDLQYEYTRDIVMFAVKRCSPGTITNLRRQNNLSLE